MDGMPFGGGPPGRRSSRSISGSGKSGCVRVVERGRRLVDGGCGAPVVDLRRRGPVLVAVGGFTRRGRAGAQDERQCSCDRQPSSNAHRPALSLIAEVAPAPASASARDQDGEEEQRSGRQPPEGADRVHEAREPLLEPGGRLDDRIVRVSAGQDPQLPPAVVGDVRPGRREQRAGRSGSPATGAPEAPDRRGRGEDRRHGERPHHQSHPHGVRHEEGQSLQDRAAAEPADDHGQERRDRAGDGGDRIAGPEARHRPERAGQRSGCGGAGRAAQAWERERAARCQPHTHQRERHPQHDGEPRQVPLQLTSDRGDDQAEDGEHACEARGHGDAEGRGASRGGRAGQRLAPGEEERDVGRKEGEAARVDGGEHAGADGDDEQALGHQPARSLTRVASSASSR